MQLHNLLELNSCR